MSNLRFVRNVGSPKRKVVYRPGFPQTYGGGCAKVMNYIFAGAVIGLWFWIVYKIMTNFGSW